MARGKLRIYLGAAPGVGKTFAMLNEGWRGHERGKDVVVGLVETHGRPSTAAQVRDLEVIPRKQIEYRGRTFEEMGDLLFSVVALARRLKVNPEDALRVAGQRFRRRFADTEASLRKDGVTFKELDRDELAKRWDAINRAEP